MKPKGKTQPIGLAAMPAAVLENTPQEDFGRNLANRKCSEGAQSAGRFTSGRKRQKEGGRLRPEAERKARNGKAELRSRNRQVEGKGRKAGTNRLTGPDAGKRCRAMKAGPNGPPSSRERGVRAARVEQSSLKAPSGTAVAQVARNQSRRAWGWWKHRPHLLLGRTRQALNWALYPATRPIRTRTPLGSLTANS